MSDLDLENLIDEVAERQTKLIGKLIGKTFINAQITAYQSLLADLENNRITTFEAAKKIIELSLAAALDVREREDDRH